MSKLMKEYMEFYGKNRNRKTDGFVATYKSERVWDFEMRKEILGDKRAMRNRKTRIEPDHEGEYPTQASESMEYTRTRHWLSDYEEEADEPTIVEGPKLAEEIKAEKINTEPLDELKIVIETEVATVERLFIMLAPVVTII